MVLLSACSFSGPPLGATSDDGGHVIDAHLALDAHLVLDAGPPPDAACQLAPSGSTTVAGHLGGPGGQAQASIACQNGGVPVGLSLDITKGPLKDHGNQVAVAAIHVRCGVLRGATTDVTEIVDRLGAATMNCKDFFSPVSTGEKLCPPGAALVGFNGNEVDSSLYNTVVAYCSDGTALPFATSGAFTNQPQTVRCPANQVVSSLNIRSVCGQDQLELVCQTLACN